MRPGPLVSQALRILLGLALALFFAPRFSLRADQKPERNGDKNTATRADPQITLEAISRDPEKWAGTAPTAVRWSEDSSKVDFQWNPERVDRSESYELDIRSSDAKPRKVADDEKRWLSSNPGERNRADTLKVSAFQGDLYLHDLRTRKVRAITRTADPESNPRFSSDGQSVVFQRGDNLFEWVIEGGEMRQLTDFRRGKDPEEKPKLSTQDEELEKEQLDLFEVIRKQDKDEKEQKERTKRERGSFPEPTYLKENESVSSLQLAPDHKAVTFILVDRTEASKAKVPDMPKYVTRSGYTETERLASQIGGAGRVKVGAAPAKQKLGVMNTADGKISYMDMGLDKREYSIQFMGPGDFGGVGGSAIAWSEDGKSAFCILRAQDNKNRWIALLDLQGAKAKVLDSEHDNDWVLSNGPYGWLPDNQTIWFRSERDGYFHIYTLSISDGRVKALTSGKWEVTAVQLSKDKTRFYLTTSETHPGERNLYTMPAPDRTKEDRMGAGRHAHRRPRLSDRQLATRLESSNLRIVRGGLETAIASAFVAG